SPHATAYSIPDAHGAPSQPARITPVTGARKSFATIMATGFDSLANDRTNRMRWPRGKSRYTVAMLAELAGLRPLPFRLELADGTVVERHLTLAAIATTRRSGGGMRISADARPTGALPDSTARATLASAPR